MSLEYSASLMDEYNCECVLLTRSIVDDPVGGYRTVWTDGIHFQAAWQYQAAPEITVAEQEGVGRTYDIFVHKTLNLDFHDAFRRVDNGQVFRVTNPGTDRHTPTFSRLNRRVIEVEKWELPHDTEE